MATIQQAPQVRAKSQPAKRRCRNQKRQVEASSRPPVGGTFLEHRFAPLVSQQWRFRKQQSAVEQVFFTGIGNLCTFYQLAPPEVADLPYPYSIYCAHEQTAEALKEQHPDVQLHIVEDDEGGLHIGTVKNYQSDHRLYYIPVQPLMPLLKRKKSTATAQLIISLMAWLHNVVDIPFFTDTSCYVAYTYESIENMANDAEDEYEENQYLEYLDEIELVKTKGAKIKQLISQPVALAEFEKRIVEYDPNTLLEAVLAEVGKQALQLCREFPNRSYLDQIHDWYEEERDYQETIQVDKYLSFHWSWEGFTGEQLHEFVNSDFQQAMHAEEPQSMQLFDTPQTKETHDFRFEEQLFDLLDSFIYVLNNLP